MHKIPRQSCNDPGDHPLKTQSKKNCLCRGIECSKQKSVTCIYDHIHNWLYLLRNFLWEQHGHTPQNRPEIQIRYPPCRKSRKQPIQLMTSTPASFSHAPSSAKILTPSRSVLLLAKAGNKKPACGMPASYSPTVGQIATTKKR